MVRKVITAIFPLLAILASCTKWEAPEVERTFTQPVANVQDVLLIDPLPAQPSVNEIAQLFTAGGTFLRASRTVQEVYSILGDDSTALMHVFNYYPSGYLITSASTDCPPILAESNQGNIPKIGRNSTFEFMLEMLKTQIKLYQTSHDSIKAKYHLMWEEYNSETTARTTLRSAPAGWDDYVNDCYKRWRQDGYDIYRYSEYDYDTSRWPGIPEDWASNTQENGSYTFDPVDNYSNYFGDNTTMERFILIKREDLGFEKKPLLTTKWGGSVGYNKYVPEVKGLEDSKAYPVGCVPVAIGQIMKYHRYPSTFNWDDMLDEKPTDATARLLYSIALAVKTDFFPTEGATKPDNIHLGLKQLGYKNTDSHYHLSHIIRDLNLNRPVLMGALHKNLNAGGHAWVCDGYKDDSKYVSIHYVTLRSDYMGDLMPISSSHYSHTRTVRLNYNLGWKGDRNGYFIADDNTTSLDFNRNLRMFTEIIPINK